MPSLAVYVAPQLGAYGWDEKPWYRPGVRLQAFLDEAARRSLPLRRLEAPPATDAELHLVHTPAHVSLVRALCQADTGSLDHAPAHVVARTRRLLQAIADGSVDETLADMGASVEDWAGFLDSEGLAAGRPLALTPEGRAWLADPEASLGGPTYARAAVEEAARWVCGAVLDATRRVAVGELPVAFVPISGFHHAFADEARLYCLYNDPALAIARALELVEGTVAYIDVDIHHGDGVAALFADHPRVVIADLHQDPAGGPTRPERRGNQYLVRLAAGTDDAAYLEAFAEAVAFVRAASPSLVVFEAGVDGLAEDPMSDQALTAAVFRDVAEQVVDLAGGRLVVLGGGGYVAEATARAWADIAAVLLER